MICSRYVISLTFLTVINPSLTNYRDCKIEQNRLLNYYKVKSCHKSSSPVILWKNVATLNECKSTARERNGLAFNFNPPEARNYTTSFMPNCQVLGCPEIGNASTLVMDLAYDYYSAYGNLTSSENYTCIKSMGIFTLTNEPYNYTDSIFACQSIGGDLADITSELRTMLLSNLIKNSISEWYKAVYVGLDDIEREGIYRTSSERLLTCSESWAPGHPRSKHKSENCVTMDADRLWRVVKCHKVKLRGLCELYPQILGKERNVPKNVTCYQHKGKKKCNQLREIFEIFQNSSRADKCALINIE